MLAVGLSYSPLSFREYSTQSDLATADIVNGSDLLERFKEIHQLGFICYSGLWDKIPTPSLGS